MINASEAREDDEDFQNPVDLMFERLEEKDPEHFAVKQYKKYKLAAGKTAKSILISCGARLAPFDIKELMTQDEIAVMDGGKCILQLRGVRPFFSDKFDITKHPNYKYLSDADKKNTFDMEKHLRRRPAIVKPDEVFDYYEIDAASLDGDADHE